MAGVVDVTKAGPESWKTKPFTKTVHLKFHASYSASEFQKLAEGLVPRQMEDKWFVYMLDDQLCFHRSWTGLPVYRVTFEQHGEGATVIAAEYEGEHREKSNLVYQAKLLEFLIGNLLLGRKLPFPLPDNAEASGNGILQHHFSGTGFPERANYKHPWWRFWN